MEFLNLLKCLYFRWYQISLASDRVFDFSSEIKIKFKHKVSVVGRFLLILIQEDIALT